MKLPLKNIIALALILGVAGATSWAVNHFHTPGHLDVITAQAMDMSQMRPPTGAAPVALASIKTGTLGDTITYTGTVQAMNEQDISPRIAGTIVSLPVYPGDRVQAGQLLARLDSAEVSAKARQAMADARAAQINAQVAQITHHLHHGAALQQAISQRAAAQQGVPEAQADAQADQDAVSDAQANVQSAQASAAYWTTEIVREKQLADAGAASQQEYQNELAQAQAAFAAVTAAKAKLSQARSAARAGEAKVILAQRQVDAAVAGVQMARADIAVAQGQSEQAGAGAESALAAAQEAAAVQDYTRIVASASGVVTARPLSPGTLVQPGTVILKVAEIDRVRVQASVAVTDLSGIHVGSPVEISSQDGGPTISARVTALFPSADLETRTAIVEAIVPNPDHRLLPGAFVSMQITKRTASEGKLLVPASAVLSQGGQSYLWITRGQSGSAASATRYRATGCGMIYSALDAKRYHYRCPMDKSKLVAIQTAAMPTTELTAHQVSIQTGDSDGALIEVASDELTPNDQVVVHGQAGLREGARVVATAWGPDGPTSLPEASSANSGATVYRCETCGMTYSEADAQKNHFIDPMDGGKLVPVKSLSQ